jgi:hypothetical protein
MVKVCLAGMSDLIWLVKGVNGPQIHHIAKTATHFRREGEVNPKPYLLRDLTSLVQRMR